MRGAQRKIRDKKHAIPHLETIPQKPYFRGLEHRQNTPYSFKKIFY